MIIYKITNIINGKVYVGKTKKTIEERMYKHIFNAKKKINRRLYDSINHHGYDNFIIEKIDEGKTNEEINEKEKEWIRTLDSFYVNGKGYNMTLGGDGGNTNNGKKQSKEWIEKRMKSVMETMKKKGKWSMSGKKHSKETIEKIRESNKNRKYKNKELWLNNLRESNSKPKSKETRMKMRMAKLGKESHKKIKLNIKELKKLLDENKKISEIARHFKVSYSVAYDRVKELRGKK